MIKKDLLRSYEKMVQECSEMTFSLPVTHVYNSLSYAWSPFKMYVEKYAQRSCEILFLGMNPGPWGMAQTGIAFGEVSAVRDWLGLSGKVGQPKKIHPKRPVDGFSCPKSEVSGARLWGWAKQRFEEPEKFFEHCFVANYCPLSFMEESGKNRTPDKLKKDERSQIFESCDAALFALVSFLQPSFVIGVGNFAFTRAKNICNQFPDITAGKILHPSPANPRANKGWQTIIEQELRELEVPICKYFS